MHEIELSFGEITVLVMGVNLSLRNQTYEEKLNVAHILISKLQCRLVKKYGGLFDFRIVSVESGCIKLRLEIIWKTSHEILVNNAPGTTILDSAKTLFDENETIIRFKANGLTCEARYFGANLIGGYYEVSERDSLDAIAREFDFGSLPGDQVKAAIYYKNKSLFLDGDINKLLTGSVILIPSQEDVRNINSSEVSKSLLDSKGNGMINIEFENRAVAFIDVLGFKAVVDVAQSDKSKLNELKSLINILEGAVPSLDGSVDQSVPKELIPKHIYISDSIILSAPIESKKMPRYRGLSILVMRVIQISHILLSKGYLIRGGIAVGSVWHTASNIVGSAYQEAYALETETSKPRVELSGEAQELWNLTEGTENSMCLDYDGSFMVNLLHDFYIYDKTDGAVKRVFDNYSQIIQKNFDDSHTEDVRSKWLWFNEYLEKEVDGNPYIRHT